jgi:hypothetical protein
MANNKVKDLNKRTEKVIDQLNKVNESQRKILKELPGLLKRLPFEKGGAVAAKPKSNGYLKMDKRILRQYEKTRAKQKRKN